MFARVGGLPCTCTMAVSYYFEYQTTFVDASPSSATRAQGVCVIFRTERKARLLSLVASGATQTAVFTPDSLAHVHITNTFGVRWHMHAALRE